VAYHEAGHALVGWLLPRTNTILKVSIIPRGRAALGFAQQLPEERYLHSKEYLHDEITTLLGGRAAEEIKFNEISSGAIDDLEKVTNIAYAQIIQYGMNSKFGTLSFSEKTKDVYAGKPFSDATSEIVDGEVSKMVEHCYYESKQIVQKNFAKLEEIALLLLKKEVLTGEDIKNILGEKVREDKSIYLISGAKPDILST